MEPIDGLGPRDLLAAVIRACSALSDAAARDLEEVPYGRGAESSRHLSAAVGDLLGLIDVLPVSQEKVASRRETIVSRLVEEKVARQALNRGSRTCETCSRQHLAEPGRFQIPCIRACRPRLPHLSPPQGGELMRIPLELRNRHNEWGNCPELLAPEDKAKLDTGEWRRAAGSCMCPDCGRPYYDHPPVLGALYMTRLCNGNLIKL